MGKSRPPKILYFHFEITHTYRNLHLGSRLTRDEGKVLKAVREGKYNILHSKNKNRKYIQLYFYKQCKPGDSGMMFSNHWKKKTVDSEFHTLENHLSTMKLKTFSDIQKPKEFTTRRTSL